MSAWVWRLLPVVTVWVTSPLLPATAIAGQTCTGDFLRQTIAQLPNDQQRPEAQKALKQCGEVAVQPLASALSADAVKTRLYTAETLGQLGWEATSAVPALVSVSQGDRDPQVRSHAVQALSAIGQSSSNHSDQLQSWQIGEIQNLQELAQQLDKSLAELEKDKQDWAGKVGDLDSLRRTRNRLQNQLRNLTNQPSYQVLSWGQSHPWSVGVGLVLVVVGSAYGAFFLGKPLTLLKVGIDDKKIAAAEKIPHVGIWLGGFLKLLSPLKYHPRVLDAWVEQYWQKATTQFLKSPTVEKRKIHIPLPVELDGKPTKELSSNHLSSTFQQKTAVLLITGEGGSGKTSLTCQIAQWGLEKQLMPHRLLPVLIETELDEKKSLIKAIEGQLKILINSKDDISPELLQKLLQHQRVLVIVDHLSEMSETTRKQVTPELQDFPAKALIVTSRLDEPLTSVKTVLKPLQIEANRLWEFIAEYLKAVNKRNLFGDDEYSDACDRLRRIAGERPITVLLARLYIDHLIQEREGAGGILPDSVPKLMLSYLNRLNQNVDTARKQDDLQVQRAAQMIAWTSLKKTYRPTWMRKEDAIAALITPAANDPQAAIREAKALVEYLENPLQLLQTPDPKVETRIILDPLAEYLAATYCVENHCQQENPEIAWRNFFQEIDQKLEHFNETSNVIRGFLLAVWDCCEDKAREGRIPDFVTTELDSKAEVNREELQRVQEKRRIRKLISELSAPELEFRIEAAEKLGKRGAAAREAARNLIGMMENRNQEIEARQAAAQTLGNLGIGAENLLTLLTDSTEELAVRRSAAESLGMMKAGQAELLQLLESDDQPLPIRQGAARALSLIGAPSGEAVPMLIVELRGEETIARPQSIPIWKEPLMEDLTLDLVAIPGGEFLMGSPPDEVGRDWYQYSFPELKDVDVEAQHAVTVSPFSMSQFPITQAQWRFVAQLPSINRDLAIDPANFKGDRRPVELVSWNDAVEFCARLSRFAESRLSQHTGKIYRLPSEAEWEYACRAGTTEPFHLGDTLSTDLANYNGTYTYGEGVQGMYRQKTTEVGSFGIVNAFGLSDMHGNVYEWCLDHWHSSYQGAPIDGSAWINEGDSTSIRVLRGGSWYNTPRDCRSAYRVSYSPDNESSDLGFRVVCSPAWT